MSDVARCAWGEILQTAPSGSSLFSFMEDLLVAGPDLIWQAHGPGRGTEMRRAFSALFGRFFARAYLETYHGFTWFAAIDGDNFRFPPNFRVRHKLNAQTEMPDWLCGGPNGLIAIAEAKGSHQRGNVTAHGKPGPIRTAERQINGVLVERRVGVKRHRRWQPRQVKGWAVMSRWGVEMPSRAPYLYALDPETDGEPLTPPEAKILQQAIARVHVEQTARGLGLLRRGDVGAQASVTKIAAQGSPEPRTWAARFSNDEADQVFLGRFMLPFGPLDIDPQQVKTLTTMLPNPSMLQFVGLDAGLLESYRANAFIEPRQRRRIGEATSVGSDGLAVGPANEAVIGDLLGPVT